jgi:hypothetical protein
MYRNRLEGLSGFDAELFISELGFVGLSERRFVGFMGLVGIG